MLCRWKKCTNKVIFVLHVLNATMYLVFTYNVINIFEWFDTYFYGSTTINAECKVHEYT